jgi:long-chain acyl-CoA synthetase
VAGRAVRPKGHRSPSGGAGPLAYAFLQCALQSVRRLLRAGFQQADAAGERLLTGVSDTFHEHEIFLTGAAGFLGKIVLALLLDRYPHFKHIHILLRPANGLSAQDRFYQSIVPSPPLRPILARAGNSFPEDRISVWQGDVSRPQCGLPAGAVEKLTGKIGVIINCAGKVDFFPPLDDSFKSNVDGVENIVAFARHAGAKLLHVSTCYVCGEADGLVEETEPIVGFYPQRRGLDDNTFDHREELLHARDLVQQIYDSTSRDGLEASRRPRELVQRLIAVGKQRAGTWGWVNTYTYAKSLGEQIIASTEGLDYAIVRPAIVESAWRFPFPGWIEGGRTAAPLVLMALDGLKDWPVREDAPLEVVPVDMAAAAVLTVAALLLEGHHTAVYQLGSADVNPLELHSVVTLLDQEARKRARNGTGPLTSFLSRLLAGRRLSARPQFVSLEETQRRQRKSQRTIARTERWATTLKNFVTKSRLPGERWINQCVGEFRKLDLQARFREQTIEQYLPFVLQNRYIFESENIRLGYLKLSTTDRDLLPWTPERIDWQDYWINNQIAGIEKWVQPEAVRDWSFRI